MVTIASLHVYPVKSCRGVDVSRAVLTNAGLAHDREWMIVSAAGRFLTQREEPRLALIHTTLEPGLLRLAAAGSGEISLPLEARAERVEALVWKDRCAALDQGEEVARWLSAFIGRDCRLVRFDPQGSRSSDRHWTDGRDAPVRFADGYAMLVISQASLADLNERLERPLPMSRFRPNLVLEDLAPYGEDAIDELADGTIRLRCVKPCTRCKITTTDQDAGEVDGDEPLRTLRTYRWSRELKGATFGQNLIVLAGAGCELYVGQRLTVTSRNA